MHATLAPAARVRDDGGMTVLVYLIPIALVLGLAGLAAFLWALRSGQFDDLDGAAHRILFDDEADRDRRDDPDSRRS